MRPHTKSLLRFTLLFFAVYGVLSWLVSIPALERVVNGFYKNSSIAVTSLILGKTELQSQFEQTATGVNYDKFIVKIGANQAELNRKIEEAKRKGASEINNPSCTIPFKSFEFFSVPILFILSLMLVSQLPLKELLLKSLLAVILMLLFIWSKFIIQVLFSINFVYPIELYYFEGIGRTVISFLSGAMTMGMAVMVGVMIWIGLTYKYPPLSELVKTIRKV